MRRVAIVLAVATLLCVLAVPAYSFSSTVNRCTAVAQDILNRADPLDRNPPPRLVAAVIQWIGLENLSSALAVTLLDRFACSGSIMDNADWTVSRPVLSWQLQREFGPRLIALYVTTARAKTSAVGFSSV